MPKRALILANGEPPKKSLLQSLVKQADLFLCADGGANAARKLGLKPNAIIGDMDSITKDTRAKFRRVPKHEIVDENSTDLEKTITWAIGQGCNQITVAGAAGKRLDHTVGNLGVLAKFYPDAIVTFVDNLGEMVYVGRELIFMAPVKSTVSLIPLTYCEGITTKGLKYALENESLEIGVREGTSNIVTANPVAIKVKQGKLLVYKLLAE